MDALRSNLYTTQRKGLYIYHDRRGRYSAIIKDGETRRSGAFHSLEEAIQFLRDYEATLDVRLKQEFLLLRQHIDGLLA